MLGSRDFDWVFSLGSRKVKTSLIDVIEISTQHFIIDIEGIVKFGEVLNLNFINMNLYEFVEVEYEAIEYLQDISSKNLNILWISKMNSIP
jgi:hypothetical protein